jgi:hypothetical protein
LVGLVGATRRLSGLQTYYFGQYWNPVVLGIADLCLKSPKSHPRQWVDGSDPTCSSKVPETFEACSLGGI